MNTILAALSRDVRDNIELLNNGGCCVYAALVGRVLENMGYEVRGCTSGWASVSVNIDEVRPLIKNRKKRVQWRDMGVPFNHVMLEVKLNGKWWMYDSCELVLSDSTNIFAHKHVLTGRFTIEELEWLSTRDNHWNPMFNRRQIPKLKRLIASYLSIEQRKAA